jgi:hypothetical protein
MRQPAAPRSLPDEPEAPKEAQQKKKRRMVVKSKADDPEQMMSVEEPQDVAI